VTIDHALDIYRDPASFTRAEIGQAVALFVDKARRADTDAQADEWNCLARILDQYNLPF
jgi:hypothetical protein